MHRLPRTLPGALTSKEFIKNQVTCYQRKENPLSGNTGHIKLTLVRFGEDAS